ncbi:hypothetical protein GCM10009809_20690 [Isoptericola hypogeus]|uniref:Uncharacterized protein n=1 Tax=Isoptericola hypogeus TaxID=300179 RepID=A0ABN2JF02_9MICO
MDAVGAATAVGAVTPSAATTAAAARRREIGDLVRTADDIVVSSFRGARCGA